MEVKRNAGTKSEKEMYQKMFGSNGHTTKSDSGDMAPMNIAASEKVSKSNLKVLPSFEDDDEPSSWLSSTFLRRVFKKIKSFIRPVRSTYTGIKNICKRDTINDDDDGL